MGTNYGMNCSDLGPFAGSWGWCIGALGCTCEEICGVPAGTGDGYGCQSQLQGYCNGWGECGYGYYCNGLSTGHVLNGCRPCSSNQCCNYNDDVTGECECQLFTAPSGNPYC